MTNFDYVSEYNADMQFIIGDILSELEAELAEALPEEYEAPHKGAVLNFEEDGLPL